MAADPTPDLIIRADSLSCLASPFFEHAVDGRAAIQRTHVNLRIQPGYLTIAFDCRNNLSPSMNTMGEHNAPLWKQEVLEVFISAGADTPTRYLEVEINPNNALFIAWIENKSGLRPEKAEMVNYEKSGIRHKIETGKSDWKGELTIPFDLIGESPDALYRLNFYRICLRIPQKKPDWECTTENSDFLCWKSTHSAPKPAFHRPKHFGLLKIEGNRQRSL